MDENNEFFDAYKKKASERTQTHEEKTSVSEAAAAADTGMNYNTESGFVKPENMEPVVTVVPRNNKRVIAAIVAALIILCVIFGIIFILNRGAKLIDFTGWTENDAQLWARNNGILLQVEKKYNDDYEAGKVLVQHTEPGTRVKKGDFVLLEVSLGHDPSVTLPLPDIMSMTKDEIDQWAAQNYMSRVRITVEYSEDVPAGQVIRYEVNDDTVVNEIRRDSPVYIIISRGPEVQDALIVLPNFKEMPLAQCYSFAKENGLVLTAKEEYDDFMPEGSILSQSTKAETKVKQGTEIVLVISKGKKILVPNFAGYTRERATAAAGGLGITIIVKERYSSAAAGSFLSQSIRAGAVYETGDILELTYSIGNQVILPSFVGSMQDALENWANDLNANGAKITIQAESTQSSSPKGTIIYQDKANMAISTSTIVNITVSLGKVVYVPDLVAPAGSGYGIAITREKAIAICEASDIIPIFQAEAKSGRLPGEIWFQSLTAGSETTEGMTITLKYVPADVQVTVPDFTGLTRAEIQSGDYDKQLEIQFVDGEAVEGKANQVTAQSLRVGSKVASGSSIILTISPSLPDE